MTSSLFGLELLAFSPARLAELDTCQRRLGRLLLRSRSAPNTVVQGDLGWQPWSELAAERAVALLPRLEPTPPNRLSSCVLRCAARVPGSWSASAHQLLQALQAPLPGDCGCGPGSSRAVRSQYLRRHVRPLLAQQSLLTWQAGLLASNDPALQVYAASVPVPRLAQVHCNRVSAASAAAWGRLRSGSSWLGAHRVARHVAGSVACCLCQAPLCDTWHALVHCPALVEARLLWWQRVGGCFPGLTPAQVPQQRLLQWFFGAGPLPPGLVAVNAAFAAVIEAAFARPGNRPLA